MIVAMALMSGYRDELQRKLVAGNAAIGVFPLMPASEVEVELIENALGEVSGVREVQEVLYAQGSVTSGSRRDGLEVTFRGVRPGDSSFGTPTGALAKTPDQIPGVLLGVELATDLEAREGDLLRLMALGFRLGQPHFRYASVRLVGTFETGFSEFDRAWGIVGRDLLVRLTEGVTSFEIVVSDPRSSGRIADEVRAALGPDFTVRDFADLNRELFAALRMQQVLLFFLLGLIVLVSTFNVASALVVLVRERLREIGVLGALGLAPGRMRRVFLLYGVALGAMGATLGLAFGSLSAWALDRFEVIRLGPDLARIYFLSAVPFQVRWIDLVAVLLFTLLVTVLACWVPARRAMRIRPAVALRYE